PINWWLVARGLKHGMLTIRPEASALAPAAMPEHMHDMPPAEARAEEHAMEHGAGQTSLAQRLGFAAATFVLLAVALLLATSLM
ncbi:MAG TPA: hypothetical protein VLA85_10820, partial [Verrucomicrobiae bacterium]|nr:hypothetical protein [Verrucomicrobiae bacterium]